MALEVTTLHTGVVVVARTLANGHMGAYTYPNPTQAQRKVDALALRGITAWVYQSPGTRVRYVAIDDPL
jgi:hypothetical protein